MRPLSGGPFWPIARGVSGQNKSNSVLSRNPRVIRMVKSTQIARLDGKEVFMEEEVTRLLTQEQTGLMLAASVDDEQVRERTDVDGDEDKLTREFRLSLSWLRSRVKPR